MPQAQPRPRRIGAYPPSGKYNLCRTKAEHAKAVAAIRKVPLPATDPAFRAERTAADAVGGQ